MLIYLKSVGFDFNEFASSPGKNDWIVEVFSIETTFDYSQLEEHPQIHTESIESVEEIDEQIKKEEKQIPESSIVVNVPSKTLMSPEVKQTIPIQKSPEMKLNKDKRRIKIQRIIV